MFKRKTNNEVPKKKGSLKARLTSRLGEWRDWLDLLLLFVVLEIPVLSLEQAHWIDPQPSLTLVLILAVLMVWFLASIRLHGALINVLALIAGGLVTLWQANRLQGAPETLPFAVFLTALTWLTGYLATWFFLRRTNAWGAVCPGALIIIVNLSNLPSRYYMYFGFFFIAAVFLIVRARLARQKQSPARRRRFFPGWPENTGW